MNTLITNIDQLVAHVRVNTSFSLENLVPDLILVQDQDLRPLLGPPLLADLLAKQAADALSEAEKTLVYHLQGALANLATVENLPLAQVQISDAGVHIFSDAGKKTAFEWQIREIRATFVRKGFNALERALELLEEGAEFAAWRASGAGTAARQYLISTAAEFSEWSNIGNSRLVFNALLPTLRKVEAFDLAPVLGPEYFAELKAQVQARTLTSENARVLSMYVRPALASLVVAKAVPEIGLSLNGQALELNVYRFDDAQRAPANSATGAPVTGLLELKVAAARADGQRYLQLLRGYLNGQASATAYATYFASSTYQPAGPRPVVRNAQVAAPSYNAF
jgi:hypothetical protein